MPFYDLRCKSCAHEFNVRATMAEKSEGRIPCPDCGSKDMATVYKSAPYYVKGGAEPVALCPNSKACGVACPHSRSA